MPGSTTSSTRREPLGVVAPLLALAGTGLFVGLWAQLAPLSFFEDFPTGEGWVATDGPYNEHLTRDVGGLNLALGLTTLAVALFGDAAGRRLAASGWLIYGIAHFVYHLHHLEPFNTVDAALVALITASTPALALAALIAGSPARRNGRTRATT
jgi:hypothetical protein